MSAFSLPARRGAPRRLLSPCLSPRLWLCVCTAAATLGAARPAAAQGPRDAVALAHYINDLRAERSHCGDRGDRGGPPLSLQAPLFQVRLEPGLLLQNAMKNAGYRAEFASAVSVSGPRDAAAAMEAIVARYCGVLTSARFSDIGVLHAGDDWVVLLAAPYRPPAVAEWPAAGHAILAAVNQARAQPRLCGARAFAAAPPVTWNEILGRAALGHSRDMAERVYFDHREGDGSDAGERAQRLGYRWSRIGENIASGLGTPQAAVDGWVASPGHCANLMNPHYTEMGAAYAVNRASENGTLYWTQVFATPR